ncbi:uncharacterized protein ACLA_020430 [Aspergillus clavatus NRRL 1]|uniref:Uncharacterized protein n=1 Tax=Aspergillus clavatus (strain ATCC 1007 / CBS 513.65 / DSM 816 / NCTC 3887 / NRRL 1 / QM 1276 / 107) TaxID=344612 RepID=A1CNW5_ASPCL|nr:uncharacterized protein ACLA_020430 [Aspergillus clavatus NRRL 1]EAW07336.1 conserved hypothetical protein [Aspergillus clavatus NRRL 1]
MGQRHNRRRTRPSSRNRSIKIDSTESSVPFTAFCNSCVPFAYSVSKAKATHSSLDRFAVPSAQTWLHGYTAWQMRERKLRMEDEQFRLFGGEPGDDEDLCYRMLEYFGGLDYIDSPSLIRPLPG